MCLIDKKVNEFGGARQSRFRVVVDNLMDRAKKPPPPPPPEVIGLKQNLALPPQPKGDTFSFTADQLVKFVATVAIQIAQPQVCYTNVQKDTVDKKSSLCQ